MDPLNSKLIRQNDFKAFMEAAVEQVSDLTAAHEQNADIGKIPVPMLASIPVDCPSVPDSYSHRHAIEQTILGLLLGHLACRGSSISAFGMGGSGSKTTID